MSKQGPSKPITNEEVVALRKKDSFGGPAYDQRFPFVLMAGRGRVIDRRSGGTVPTETIFPIVINVAHMPTCWPKIERRLRGGAKIIRYGNFPQRGSKKAILYSGGAGNSPWDILAANCDRAINDTVEAAQVTVKLRDELSEAQKRIAEKDAKIAELEASKPRGEKK